MSNSQNLCEGEATVKKDSSRYVFQNTPFHRFVATVVGFCWAFCGTVGVLRLLAQPMQLPLIYFLELAIAAMFLGACLFIWGIWTPGWVPAIGKRIGDHTGKVLFIMALPAIIEFVLKLL